MLRPVIAIVVGVSTLLMAGAASAQERTGRYTLSPVEGGFLRLDTETGAIAMCARSREQWACEPVNDAARDEAQKLRSENKDLKTEMKRMEEMILGEAKPAPQSPRGAAPPVELPKEEDIDRAINELERIFKKYRERLREFDRSLSEQNRAPSPAPPPTPPQVPTEPKAL